MPRWRLVVPPVFVAALLAAIVIAPDDAFLKSSQRIFYIHLAAAWTGSVAYLVSFAYAILYLVRRRTADDRVSAVSAEIGTMLITAVLVSGSIWARVAWNTWWTWDPRLITTAVLWFLYIGYFVLRGLIDRPSTRATASAVFNIVAFLDLPLVYLSVRWWVSIHPVIFTDRGPALAPSMLAATGVFAVAMLLFYLDLLGAKLRLARAEEELYRLKADLTS
jgi:heme exporter protein C